MYYIIIHAVYTQFACWSDEVVGRLFCLLEKKNATKFSVFFPHQAKKERLLRINVNSGDFDGWLIQFKRWAGPFYTEDGKGSKEVDHSSHFFASSRNVLRV